MSAAEAAPGAGTSAAGVEELAAAGGVALDCDDWAAAHACFAAAVSRRESPELLEQLGLAAFWLEDGDGAIGSRQRAYVLYQRAGRPRDAGRMATWLAWDHSAFRGEHAIAGGWLARAHRVLDPLQPGQDHVWLALREAARVIGSDVAQARALAALAAQLAEALGLEDHRLAARAIEGLTLVSIGDIARGTELLAEAAGAARDGRLTDLVLVTLVWSQMIDACERMRDFDGLAIWSARLVELCERRRVAGLVGVGRAHGAAALVAAGSWAHAEAELAAATRQIERTVPGMLPECHLRLAELRRQQGRFDEARALVARAGAHALAPLTAAAIALDEDDPVTAAELATQALDACPGRGRLERAPGLGLLVRAGSRLAAPPQPPDRSLEELREMDGRIDCAAVAACAARAEGAAAIGRGAPADAAAAFERAHAALDRCGPVHEHACVRDELASVLAALGRADDARREAAAAAAAFDALGTTAPAMSRRRAADR